MAYCERGQQIDVETAVFNITLNLKHYTKLNYNQIAAMPTNFSMPLIMFKLFDFEYKTVLI